MAWEAAPGLVSISVALQVLGSAALAVEPLYGKHLLPVFVANRHGGVGPLGAGPAILTASTAIVGFAGLARWDLNRPLATAVGRCAMGQVLDVAASIDLLAYATPEFHDRLQRATVNAQSRPMQMTTGFLSLGGSTIAVVGIRFALLLLQPIFVAIVLLAYIRSGWPR